MHQAFSMSVDPDFEFVFRIDFYFHCLGYNAIRTVWNGASARAGAVRK